MQCIWLTVSRAHRQQNAAKSYEPSAFSRLQSCRDDGACAFREGYICGLFFLDTHRCFGESRQCFSSFERCQFGCYGYHLDSVAYQVRSKGVLQSEVVAITNSQQRDIEQSQGTRQIIAALSPVCDDELMESRIMVDEPMEMSGAALVESWNLVTDTSYVACLPWKVVCSLLHGSGDGWVLRSSWTNLQSLIPEAAQRRKQYANSRLEALEDIDMDLAETISHTSNLLPTGHQNVGECENWDKLVLALRGHTSNNPRLAKLMLLIQSCNP